MTPEELGVVLALFKANGVQRFKGLGLEVDMAPTAQPPGKSMAEALSELEAKAKCACGHAESTHNPEGDCLIGCATESCYPGHEVKPPEATA